MIERAASLWAVRERELPARMALEEAFQLRQVALGLYQRARSRYPKRVEALAARVARYAQLLEEQSLRDEHVSARYPREEVLAYVIGSATLLLFWLPLALLGSLMNWLPYRLIWAGARMAPDENLPATIKLLGGFFLYPLTWLAWALLAAASFGRGAALATLLLGPLAAWFAMLFHERYEHFFEHARAYAVVTLRPGTARRLERERAELHRELREIARDAAAEPPREGGER